MSKLSSFLPQMAAANEALEKDIALDPEGAAAKYDVNHCEEDEEGAAAEKQTSQKSKLIEMNIAIVPLEQDEQPQA